MFCCEGSWQFDFGLNNRFDVVTFFSLSFSYWCLYQR